MSDLPHLPPQHIPPRFGENVSIVLVGALGTGKSTLAVIAQKSFGLRLVDIASLARQEHGFPLSAVEHVLQQHTEECVIVWPARFLNEPGLLLLKSYSETHPVIHITRAAEGVRRYFKTVDALTVQSLLDRIDKIYRTCSNLEFHNLDERSPESTLATRSSAIEKHDIDPTLSPRTLILKNLELAFVHFVNSTVRNTRHDGSQREDCLLVPPTRSPYTYSLSVPLEELDSSDMRRILNCGADACQLEIDLGEDASEASDADLMKKISRAMAMLIRYFNGPVVYHVAFTQRHQDFHRYWALLNHGIRTGACYITLDMSLSKDRLSWVMSSMAGRTLIIGTFHDGKAGEHAWHTQHRWEIYEAARSLGMNGLRLTQPVRVSDDNLAVLGFRAKVAALSTRWPFLIAYNTGLEGRPSLYLNHILTPVSMVPSRPVTCSNDSITIEMAQKALFALSVWDALNFYIIGVDVSRTLSPAIHRKAYQHFAMPHTFQSLSIASLDGYRALLGDTNLGGISIAQGYKITILPYVRAMSTDAKNIGAINTLIPMRADCAFDGIGSPPNTFWRNRGRAGEVVDVYGENTDWIGMARCIHGRLSPANAIASSTSALVIGAGGMARAATYALIQLDVKHIVIYNRTLANARKIAKHFSGITVEAGPTLCPFVATGFGGHASGRLCSISPDDLDIRVIESCEADWFSDLVQPTIVVSCVPASRVGDQPGASFTLPPAWMRSNTGGVVLDLNYRPVMTPLLRQVNDHMHRG